MTNSTLTKKLHGDCSIDTGQINMPAADRVRAHRATQTSGLSSVGLVVEEAVLLAANFGIKLHPRNPNVLDLAA